MLEQQVKFFFDQLILNNHNHAKWLNMISYLEYRGARKIFRSLKTEDMTESILKHSYEESRHAYFLKKQAIKIGGDSFNSYRDTNRIGVGQFKKYFYELDLLVNEFSHLFFKERTLQIKSNLELNPSKMISAIEKFSNKCEFEQSVHTDTSDVRVFSYQLETWLIEERALFIYQIYEKALLAQDSMLSIESILKEESSHLLNVNRGLDQYIQRKFNSDMKSMGIAKLIKRENDLFISVWGDFVQTQEVSSAKVLL